MFLLPLPTSVSALAQGAIDYDVVYVRQPRYGDFVETIWPEVFHPARMEPGADLVLLHPDGSEEVLFAGGEGSVTDPAVSLDGKAMYFSWFPKLQPGDLNGQRNLLSYGGADLYRIDLARRASLFMRRCAPPAGRHHPPRSDPRHLALPRPRQIHPGTRPARSCLGA
jgi:hypothetical protein